MSCTGIGTYHLPTTCQHNWLVVIVWYRYRYLLFDGTGTGTYYLSPILVWSPHTPFLQVVASQTSCMSAGQFNQQILVVSFFKKGGK